MAKGKSPAFQFYPDAWLSSSSITLMTSAEEGAYIRLLCHAWQSPDCGLPDDDEALAELSRLRSHWDQSKAKLRRKFTALGGRLFNDRLIEEKQKQLAWHDKSVEGGRKSAKARAESKGGCDLVGVVVDECLQPNGQPKVNSSSSSSSSSPSLILEDQNHCASGDARVGESLFALEPLITTKRKAPTSKRYALTTEQTCWFDQWWGVYWLSRDKKKAIKAFAFHVETEFRFQQVMLATKAQKPEMMRRDPEKRPYGATWLNGERWEDSTVEARASPTDTTGSKSTDAVMELAKRNIERTGRIFG